MDNNRNYDFASDEVFQDDVLANAVRDDLFQKLDNKSILITGSTGLIGHHLVLTFLKRNDLRKCHTKIIAPVRNLKKARSIYGSFFLNDDINFIENDIVNPLEIDSKVDYIVHGASITSSKSFVKKPVQTIEVAYEGTKNILNLARKKKIRNMVYLSSLEVYGIVDKKTPEVTESDLGKIDILAPRSSYSESKRLVECLNSAYASQYGISVVNARLAQTFGSGVSVDDSRVFAQFARAALYTQDINLNTDGATYRDYCYITDAIQGILILLTSGRSGEAYNLANESTYCSIKEMAELVSTKIMKDRINVNTNVDDTTKHGYAPELRIKLLSQKIQKLGWKPEYDLTQMFDRLIRSMASRLA